MPKQKKHHRASALLLATILLFAILTIIISLSSVTVMEMKMSQKGKTSVASFYDAESGVEWALHKVSTSTGNLSTAFPTPATDGSVTCPSEVGATGCKVYFLKSDGTTVAQADFASTTFADIQAVRSVGREGNDTQRAIEAAVADTTVCSAVPKEIESVEQSPASIVAALTYCRNKGGCWHLPSIEELMYFTGSDSDTSYLWAGSFWGNRSYAMLRLSDGRTDNIDCEPGSCPLHEFRCVR
jgi:hypothetical protein